MVLAVEIVSEGPLDGPDAQAGAVRKGGHPLLLADRGEDDGLVVHTYRIDPVDEVYLETGRWTKFVDTGEPLPVNLSIARITPRRR